MNKHFKNLVSALTVVFFAFIAYGSLGKDKKDSVSSSTSKTSITENSSNLVKIGEPLQTEYFEVTVKKISIEDKVKTGNQFTELKKEEGIRYLILNTTFKNISDESRMLMDGEVLINYNGKEYNFDHSETILSDGWGLLGQINPLTTKTTNLVYKIPAEIKGEAYYRPGRSGKKDLIELGVIE
ncbi:DUF4352 domain-containing protein [uncultured Apibacter sp.]|uniref:DUF4352 domain-containing protein n=1 Tax=uncultured Apibacter sp. TaxID=1778616 RepID=UPI0025CE8048|nr:DUF4352 domain-containing protein [uncultured Apibacter sp.]